MLIAESARIVNNTWTDLVRVRASERIVSQIDSEAGRVQSLIHRYFTQPSPELVAEVESRWNALQSNLIPRAAEDPVLQLATRSLSDLTNIWSAASMRFAPSARRSPKSMRAKCSRPPRR